MPPGVEQPGPGPEPSPGPVSSPTLTRHELIEKILAKPEAKEMLGQMLQVS